MNMSVGWVFFYLLVFPGFLFTSVVGLLYTWIDRKVTARVQFRVGPPLLQPFYDFFKLLGKDTFVPEGAPRSIFLGAPLVGLASVSVLSTVLLVSNMFPQQAFAGDLIVVLYLFVFVPIILIIGASASSNPISALGASREMTLYLAYELPLLFALATIIVKSGGLLKIGDLLQWQWANHPFLYSASGAIAFVSAFLCMQAKLGFVPFDIAEAEQEIMGGTILEYSGPALAVLKLTKAMLYFTASIFLTVFFWGGFRSPRQGWYHILGWLKPVAIIVLIILIKNTNPRLRIDQALRFFWSIVLVLSIVGFILAAVGL
ncbi:MAG: NADH-quinone oxidoreductase subunit H [Candidatus Stahlbacteria bacterium]|nr:MAG: NADH-quinone oxidoreductase subunit H [Candidatus Stahlbacteria bacterium]